jgi:hypothetical protein
LDLAENSAAAGASRIEIEVCASVPTDELQVAIRDNGRGIPPEKLQIISDPFVTSRTTRKVGLGIPLLKAAAEACNGSFSIESNPGVGTKVAANFQLSHIDRMPVGDLSSTLVTLVIGHPEINWVFRYQVKHGAGQDPYLFDFDDAEIKAVVGEELPLCHPDVLAYLDDQISTGLNATAQVDSLNTVQF